MTDRLGGHALRLCALGSALATVGIVAVLISESWGFFAGLADAGPAGLAGFLRLLNGTLLVAIGAGVIALPLGLGCAVFLSEFASAGTQRIVRPMLEMMAGIPTVVYGFFAVFFVTPVVRAVLPGAGVFSAASASAVVAIMVLPMITSMSERSISNVNPALKEAALGLGATPTEASRRVVVPAARAGIMSSVVLAFGRAVGETMIVTLAAGTTPRFTLNPLESIQTLTAFTLGAGTGDPATGSRPYETVFAVGLVLCAMAVGITAIGRRLTSGGTGAPLTTPAGLHPLPDSAGSGG